MGSELLKIADGLSMVAEGLRGVAGMEKTSGAQGKNTTKEQADAEQSKKPDKKNTADDTKEKPVAVEDIRAVMAQKSQEGKTKEIRELLQKFGAVKLSAVKQEDYPALLQEAQVL